MNMLNTYFQYLPSEITEKIFLIVFKEKRATRIIHNSSKNMLLKKKIIVFQNIIDNHFEDGSNVRMQGYNLTFMKKNYDKEEVILTFDKCKCCTRHQKNRPKKLAPWQELDFSSSWKDFDCSCQCRHYSRHICRGI